MVARRFAHNEMRDRRFEVEIRLTNLITDREPPTWEALEEAVRGILAECGMVASRQVSLSLPRGAVAVDVYATEVVHGITSITICECKNWKTSVPQEVVFGFRTVMAETGANRGYIISKNGFQSGAVLAAQATNIDLLTFEQFQAQYFDKWASARLWALERSIGNIASYYEPFGIPGMDKLTNEDEQEHYFQIWKKYVFVGAILPGFSPYLRSLSQTGPIRLPNLPIDVAGAAKFEITIPDDLVALTGYQEFLEVLERYALEGLAELRALNPNTRDMPSDQIERDD